MSLTKRLYWDYIVPEEEQVDDVEEHILLCVQKNNQNEDNEKSEI